MCFAAMQYCTLFIACFAPCTVLAASVLSISAVPERNASAGRSSASGTCTADLNCDVTRSHKVAGALSQRKYSCFVKCPRLCTCFSKSLLRAEFYNVARLCGKMVAAATSRHGNGGSEYYQLLCNARCTMMSAVAACSSTAHVTGVCFWQCVEVSRVFCCRNCCMLHYDSC
jgi:hypothetical protein